MSRSILKRAFSALRRASSICSGDTLATLSSAPAPLKSPFANWRTQLPRVALGMPKTLATTAMAWPARTWRTASILNSCVYCARTCLCVISQLLVDIFNKAKSSTFRGQPQFAMLLPWWYPVL